MIRIHNDQSKFMTIKAHNPNSLPAKRRPSLETEIGLKWKLKMPNDFSVELARVRGCQRISAEDQALQDLFIILRTLVRPISGEAARCSSVAVHTVAV